MVRYPAVRADGGSATVVIARATVEYEDLVKLGVRLPIQLAG